MRPGEAAESLIQNAVDLRSVVAVSLNIAKPNNPGRIIDQMLFRSRLSRMKTVLEQERKYHEIVGTMLGHGIGGHLYALETELAELGRKSIDEELVQEFEALLTEFDKLYADVEKSQNENRIKNHRR